MNASEEKVLRENIRHMIKLVKQKKGPGRRQVERHC
jgi:hypothetical protein